VKRRGTGGVQGVGEEGVERFFTLPHSTNPNCPHNGEVFRPLSTPVPQYPDYRGKVDPELVIL